MVREPYFTIAELALGPYFRKLVVLSLYATMIASALGYVLLSATMMTNTFSFEQQDFVSSLRIWVSIICVLMTPLMFYGTLVDISGAAVFAVWASSISLLCMYVVAVVLILVMFG